MLSNRFSSYGDIFLKALILSAFSDGGNASTCNRNASPRISCEGALDWIDPEGGGARAALGVDEPVEEDPEGAGLGA